MATNVDAEEFFLSYLMEEDFFEPELEENMLPAACVAMADLLKDQVVKWDLVMYVVRKCPTICGEKDHDGMLLLHLACALNAPLCVIELLVHTWPSAVRDRHQWIALHLACIANAPVEVVRFLAFANEEMLSVKDDHGYSPIMYLVRSKRGANLYACLGKFNHHYPWQESIADDDDDNQWWNMDINRTMCRLEHDDPNLTCLHLIGTLSEWYRLLDYISCHCSLNEIHLEWYDIHSWLWTGGEGQNNTPALNSVLSKNRSIRSIHVNTCHSADISHIVDVVKNCRQLESLSITFKGESWEYNDDYNDGNENEDGVQSTSDHAAIATAQSVNKLPLLQELYLWGATIEKEGATALTTTLFKKRTMKILDMSDSDISKEAAHIFVEALKKDSEHTFTEVRLFSWLFHGYNSTIDCWKGDINFELKKVVERNNHIASVHKFACETVQQLESVSFYTCSGQENVLYDHQVLDAMEKASKYDNTERAPWNPPDYLYSLIRENPQLIRRAIVYARELHRVRMEDITRENSVRWKDFLERESKRKKNG